MHIKSSTHRKIPCEYSEITINFRTICFMSVQEMENPILIQDKKISNMDSLLPALEISIKVNSFIYVLAFGAMTSDEWYLSYVESQASSHCC